MLRQAKQLLHADVQGGCACYFVVEGQAVAGLAESRLSIR
jgi:hypothetical protein